MITVAQASEYLTSVGVDLPDFLLAALVEQVNTVEPCLVGAGHSPGVILLIQSYLLGLIGLSQGDRYVSSQTALSGASQSFRFQSVADRYRGLYGLLRNLDRTGCTTGLIPPNPGEKVLHAGLWVAGTRKCR